MLTPKYKSISVHFEIMQLCLEHDVKREFIKGTLMEIWKSANLFAFIWKYNVEGFTLKHLLIFEICAREMCEKFAYKHSETIEFVKN